MKLQTNSKVWDYKDLIMSEEEKENVFIPDNILDNYGRDSFFRHLVKKGNDIYYKKYDNEINELIGSYLSNKLKLDNVNYELGYNEGFFFIMSKLFYNENYDYFFAKDCEYLISEDEINNAEYSYIDHLHMLEDNIKIKLLKLIAIDIKMGQFDRHSKNLMFQRNNKTGNLDLSPVYDFSNSYFEYSFYNDDRFVYNNSFLRLDCDKNNLKRLCDSYPNIKEYFYILKNISMGDILSDLEKEHGVKIEDYEQSFRINLDKDYTKRLNI